MLSIDDHHSVGLGEDGSNALEAAAAGHRVIHHRVGIEPLDIPVRRDLKILVDAFPLPFHLVERLSLLDRLIRTVGVHLETGCAVKPRVCPAQAESLRRHHADVIRRIGLAKHTRVEGLRVFIQHAPNSLIALPIDGLRFFQRASHFLRVSDDRHLDLVNDGAKLLAQLGDQDLAVMFQAESFLERLDAESHPHDRTLAHVEYAVGPRGELVNAPLNHRFEVFPEIAARNFHDDAKWQRATHFDFIDIRTDDFNVAVLNLAHRTATHQFECVGVLAAKLDLHLFLADSLTLESGTIGHGNRDLAHLELQAANLHRLVDNLIPRNP